MYSKDAKRLPVYVPFFELEDDVSSILLTARSIGDTLTPIGRGTVSNRSFAKVHPAVQPQTF
jgi:hypothetical protein